MFHLSCRAKQHFLGIIDLTDKGIGVRQLYLYWAKQARLIDYNIDKNEFYLWIIFQMFSWPPMCSTTSALTYPTHPVWNRSWLKEFLLICKNLSTKREESSTTSTSLSLSSPLCPLYGMLSCLVLILWIQCNSIKNLLCFYLQKIGSEILQKL